MGLFALNGLTMSSWLARLPEVCQTLGLDPSGLGVVLFAGAVGALSTVMVAGLVVTRFGGRLALMVSAAGFTAAFVLLGLGTARGSIGLLTAGVFVNGVSFALSNVAMNVESAAIERRMGRSVLPHFHAAFSVGAVLGSAIGAATAHFGISLATQFLLTAAVGAALRVPVVPHVILDSAPARRAPALADAALGVGVARGTRGLRGARAGLGAGLSGWREPRTLLIGVVIMAAALSEGSANNWLALAVVRGFDEPAAAGAVVFGVFVASMTVVRVLGTRLIDRFGRVTVLRTSGLVSLVGLLVFGLAPTLVLAGVGVVAWGLGAALAVPIGIAAASDDPLRAAGRVSVVSAFASLASLAAPPLLGVAVQSLGARHALLLITVAMVASVALARRVVAAAPRPAAILVPAAPLAPASLADIAPALSPIPAVSTIGLIPSPRTPQSPQSPRSARGGEQSGVADMPESRSSDRLAHIDSWERPVAAEHTSARSR